MDKEDQELWEEYQGQTGGERGELYTGGLLRYPLWDLIPRWLAELKEKFHRDGLSGSKDRSSSDVPPKPGAVEVEATDERRVWITPDAYRDEDGNPRAEVRERYSRTDGAIWVMLAVLEGGEGPERDSRLDERGLREHYAAWRHARVAGAPVHPPSERLLDCAEATARHFHPDLDELPEGYDELPEQERQEMRRKLERDRQETVLGFARRIHSIAKTVRQLQEYAERGRVDHPGPNPARDVAAAELRDLKGWSWVEIGDYLHIPQNDSDKIKGENQTARKAAERGREYLRKSSG